MFIPASFANIGQLQQGIAVSWLYPILFCPPVEYEAPPLVRKRICDKRRQTVVFVTWFSQESRDRLLRLGRHEIVRELVISLRELESGHLPRVVPCQAADDVAPQDDIQFQSFFHALLVLFEIRMGCFPPFRERKGDSGTSGTSRPIPSICVIALRRRMMTVMSISSSMAPRVRLGSPRLRAYGICRTAGGPVCTTRGRIPLRSAMTSPPTYSLTEI